MTNKQFKDEIIKAFSDAGYIRISNCIFTETMSDGISFNYKIKVRSNDKVVEIEFDTDGRQGAVKVLSIVLEAKYSYPKSLAKLMINRHGSKAQEKAKSIIKRASEAAMKPNAEREDILHYYQYKNVLDDINKLTF